VPFLFIILVCLVSLAFSEDSLRISKIYIYPKDVFDDAVVHTPFEKELYKFGNWFHIETKESVIRAKLPFGEGDVIPYSEMQNTEKNLRALSYISDAKIEAKKDSLGNTDLYVETSDNWTFAPTISLGKPGEKWLWEAGLLENNLFGFGQTVGFFFKRGEDRDQKYLLYRTDDFIFPHNKFNFLLSENTDGFSRYVGLSYPFISRVKNQWAYDVNWLWSERDENFYESKKPEPVKTVKDLKEDSLSIWLQRSFGGASFKTYLGMGYDYHKIESREAASEFKDSRLGFSLAASRIHLEKRYNLHRVKWAEDVERGYYIKTAISKNFEELGADNDDWHFMHNINLSLGTGGHNFLAKGLNSFYCNGDSIRDMHSSLFGEYIFKPGLRWSSVLSANIESWQKTGEKFSVPNRQLYLDGYNIFPGFPSYYLVGENTFSFKAEQRYFPDFELLTQVPSFAVFLTAGQATGMLREFEPRDLIYMAGIGLRGSSSKSVQGIVSHINLSWPLNGELKNGFSPRFSFIGKVEL
jgi:hemolysin activation/secretion protein